MAAINYDGYASPEILSNKVVVMSAVSKDGMVLEYVPDFQNDKEVALVAVTQNGMAFQFVPLDLKMDVALVCTASHTIEAFQFIHPSFQTNDDFINYIVEHKIRMPANFPVLRLRVKVDTHNVLPISVDVLKQYTRSFLGGKKRRKTLKRR